MGWFNKKPASASKHGHKDMRGNRRETVEAYLYERPGKRSELPLQRDRRGQANGRYAYR